MLTVKKWNELAKARQVKRIDKALRREERATAQAVAEVRAIVENPNGTREIREGACIAAWNCTKAQFGQEDPERARGVFRSGFGAPLLAWAEAYPASVGQIDVYMTRKDL